MQILSFLLLIIATITDSNIYYISSKKEFYDALVKSTETSWMVVSVSDSFENEILAQMAQDSAWQKELADWEPISFQELITMIKQSGHTIIQTEPYREVVFDPRPWIPKDRSQQFANEFLSRFNESHKIAKQILIKISLSLS